MIVYHGSSEIVIAPDTEHSYRNLDFGKGFYVTSVKEQAERWARRKAGYVGTDAGVVSIYEMPLVYNDLQVLDLSSDMEKWIDFVCKCRDGENDYLQYDLIKGKVANDKVFRVVDMYHSGIWDKKRALKEIKAYPTYDQIAFISQKAIDQLLIFQDSYQVGLLQ